MKSVSTFLVILFTVFIPVISQGVPRFLNHQGRIIQSDDNPVSSVANVIFKLYLAPTGGSVIWSQTLSVAFDNGYYSVVLGPGTPELSAEIFDVSDLYLGVTLEGTSEFEPRYQITSVPYAILAEVSSVSESVEGGLVVDGVEVMDSDGNMHLPGELTIEGSMTLPQSYLGGLAEASEANKGQVFYVTDQESLYYSNGSEWVETSGGGSGNGSDISPPVIASLSPSQIEPGQDVVVEIHGQDFESGCEVEFGENMQSDLTFIGSTQVNVNTGTELQSGTYNVRLINPIGWRDTRTDGLVVDAVPQWQTTAGSLGTVADSMSGDHFTLVVTDLEDQDLTYSVVSGALPPGLNLNSETGVIWGDPDDIEGEIEYNFDVRVTDTAHTPNSVDRSFAITIIDLINYFGDISDGVAVLNGGEITGLSLGGSSYGSDYHGTSLPDSNVYEAPVSNPSGSYNGDMVVLNFESLTIDSGYWLTTDQPSRGLMVFVRGDCIINGTISMMARGAKADPQAHGVNNEGLQFPYLTEGGSTDLSTANLSPLAGCGDGDNAETIGEIFFPHEETGTIFTIQKYGEGPTSANQNGYDGSNGTSGSGGGGRQSCSHGGTSTGGSRGSCFSGGSGGAGNHQCTSVAPEAFGGAGGRTCYCGGNGAGNPSWQTDSGSTTGYGYNGTGGTLILVVGGTLSGSGTITAQGTKGGYVNHGQCSDGSGSGGGNILILSREDTFSGTVTADGEERGVGASNCPGYRGGNGSVQKHLVQ